MNVFETLTHAALAFAGRPAIIDGANTLTYQDLWREVEALRLQLDRQGVRPGQGVGVLARNGRGFVIAALAALGCGAVVMPIYHQLKPGELTDLLARASITALIDDGSGPQRLDGIHHTLGLLDRTPLHYTRITGRTQAPIAPWLDDAAFVRFTSGTTGSAKGVVLTHAGTLERIAAANAGLSLGPEDRVLWVLPMAYHFFASIVLYLNAGSAIVLCPDHLAGSILDAAEHHQATFLYAAPLHVRMLAAESSGRPLATSLKQVMSVSSRLAPQNAIDFKTRFGQPITQGYGIIEIGLPIMNLTDADTHPESIGRPLPGFEAAILGEDMKPAPEGETGELAVRGPGMFAGYLSPPMAREEVLREGWFMTGDLAHRDASGLITIDGRSKSVINVAGHKVFPEEVAAVLEQHPAVFRSRVTTVPHPQWGEVIHAEIQPRGASVAISSEDILAFCRRRLSSFKVPASVAVVSELDMTPSGKVRHG